MKKEKFIPLILLILFNVSTIMAQQWGDYTFYSVQDGTTAYLVNNSGTTSHSWSFNSSAKTGYSSYLLPGGTVLRTVARQGNQLTGAAICGEVQKVDLDGNVIWDFVYSSSTYCTHHDVCPMPNGNVLLISYDVHSASEATQAGCSQSMTIWAEKIIEVQPTGTNTGIIVWEWKVWDHLVQNYNSGKDNYQTSIVQHPELININYQTSKDWMHVNGVDYNPVLDQIVFSSHNLNEIYVIDHSTTTAEAASHSGGNSGKGGDILYRWGNPAAYSASGTKIFYVVHDAHWVPQSVSTDNNIVAFNNNGVSSNKSAVDMIAPPHDDYNYTISLGSAFLPSTYTTRHQCNGHSNNMSNSQQLPNGNQLVCIAQSGSIYEINSAGTSIWTKSVSGTVPKAFRYSQCYIDGDVPPTPTITIDGENIISSEATTYQWYLNGNIMNGETSETLTPTEDGIYLVRTTDENGCMFAFSQDIYFDYVPPVVDIDEMVDSDLSIFPNPTNGIINLNINSDINILFNITITDIYGNKLYETKNINQIDISTFSNGIYYISVSNENIGIKIQKIILIK